LLREQKNMAVGNMKH